MSNWRLQIFAVPFAAIPATQKPLTIPGTVSDYRNIRLIQTIVAGTV